MASDFATELSTWKTILSLRKGTVGFFVVLTVLLVALFLVMVWEFRSFQGQLSQLTTQMEVMAELNPNLPDEQLSVVQEQVESWDDVVSVEYWSPDRSAVYIDQQVMPGYLSFLQRNQLEVPVQPLLRIQVGELAAKEAVEGRLRERFSGQVTVISSPEVYGDGSFAGQFIGQLIRSTKVFRWLVVFVLVCLLASSGYVSAFLLSERSHGFHLKQWLHLTPAYRYWPAFLVVGVMSLLMTLAGMVVAALFTGHVLLLVTLLLFGVMLFLDFILVWFGRFVVTKWGMR